MPGIELATAYISLVAETKDLARGIQRDLGQVGDKAGRQAGDDFASNFTRQARKAKAPIDSAGDGAGRAGSSAGGDFADSFGRKAKSGMSGALEESMAGAKDAGGKGGLDLGGSFMDGFGGKIGALGSKAGPIGAALTAAGGLGLIAGAALAKGVMDGFGQMQQRDMVQARLGVNDQAMQTIGTAAGGAFANAWGESVGANLETAQLAIQTGILDGDDAANEMQPVIEKLNVVNDLIGGEMQTTIGATSILLRNGLAKDAEGAFDVITRAYQRGGAVADDLIDSIKEYGDGWERTGFSGEFAMGLIIQSMENGADNTDRASDAMREFGRRMYEDTDKIKGALGDLSLPVDDLFNKLKSGGPETEAAFDQIFDAIRVLPDPLERAAIAQQLLGDTAGDFINAFTEWDPSKAQESFGKVQGAAQSAADTMSSNPMSQWQSAMNTVSVEADSLKMSLAGAFAPIVTDLANWVSAHKPEIIGFFTDLGTGTLTALDYLSAFASGGLRMFANLADGIGKTVGTSLAAIGQLGSGLGGMLKHIPGMEGLGGAIEDTGKFLESTGGQMATAGDKARGLADMIDNTLRPGLQGARDDLGAAGAQAQNTEILMRALGEGVQAVPGEKSIIVSSNSPQQQAQLEALGLKVTQLPDGKFEVTSNTTQGQQIVDDFITRNNGRPVTLSVQATTSVAQSAISNTIALAQQRAQNHARGGFISGPGTGTSDSILSWLSDGEFVVNAKSTSKARPVLEAINAGWVPPADLLHEMVPGYASGGLVSADDLNRFAQGVEGAPYEWGGVNWGDCSGAVSAIANYATGNDPFGSRFATGNEGAALADMGFQPGLGPAGSLNIGWFNGGPYGGHTAATLPNGVNFEMGGQRGDGQYGGIAAGADDPMFTDRMHLPPEAFLGGDPGVMGGAPSGGAAALGGGGGQSGGGSGGGGGFSGGGGSGGAGGSASGGAVSVFVTNWPGSFTPAAAATPLVDPAAPAASNPVADDTDQFDPQKRLDEFGVEARDIGVKAALSMLGLEGTVADPDHRYWQAARDTQAGFAEAAEQLPQGADNSIHIGEISVANVDELIKRLQLLQKTQTAGFVRR